jgi:hypothetical protein
MRTSRLTTASLAAVLSTALLGTPASAMPAPVGHESQTPLPQPAPTWPVDPQVIPRSHEVATDSGSGLDWDSAGIGAATVLGAFAMGTAGAAVVRRRRVRRVPLSSH